MVSLKRDQNRIPTIGATLNTDGVTVVNVAVNPVGNGLTISNGNTGTSYTSVNAKRDDNRVPVMWGVSSADGVTPIPIYADSNGKLLIKST